LAQIDDLLHAHLDSDLRAFLQAAQVIVRRAVAGCDDAIAELDREREVRREPDNFLSGGSP
jgi:hypothetical protein